MPTRGPLSRGRNSGQRPAGQFFNVYAHDFDAIYGANRNPIRRLIDCTLRKSMRLRFERSVEGCMPVSGHSVLDIGCGPGHYMVALAREGAQKVVGVDLAEEMLTIARRHAEDAGVSDRCGFIHRDFRTYRPAEPFDFSIVMGVMDYIKDAEGFVRHVLEMTRIRAFFSFPAAGGVLAAIRRFRYRNRTPLYLYRRSQLEGIFERAPRPRPGQSASREYSIERLARDFFVEVDLSSEGGLEVPPRR